MVSAIPSSRLRIGFTAFVLGLTAMALAHVAYVFIVYRARVVVQSPLASSDFVVFAHPRIACVRRVLHLRARSPAGVDAALGRGSSADTAVSGVESVAAVQGLWNLAPRRSGMAQTYLTRRCSEPPVVLRSQLP